MIMTAIERPGESVACDRCGNGMFRLYAPGGAVTDVFTIRCVSCGLLAVLRCDRPEFRIEVPRQRRPAVLPAGPPGPGPPGAYD